MSDPAVTRPPEGPDPILAKLMVLLDVVVLERLEGGAFRQVGIHPAPVWFTEAFRDVSHVAPVTLLQAFPVLDSFLTEAEIFWERSGWGRFEGEAFVVEGPGGRNLPLAAIAVALDGRQFLLIQHVTGFDDRQHILQTAREQALAQEGLVKRIDALRRPFEKISTLAIEFAGTPGLSERQQGLLSGITSELETLRTLLETLPKLPPGRSARR